MIYCILGFLLPVNPYEDEDDPRNSKHTYYYNPEPDDFVNSKSDSDASERYERRKKENEWDSRFNSGK